MFDEPIYEAPVTYIWGKLWHPVHHRPTCLCSVHCGNVAYMSKSQTGMSVLMDTGHRHIFGAASRILTWSGCNIVGHIYVRWVPLLWSLKSLPNTSVESCAAFMTFNIRTWLLCVCACTFIHSWRQKRHSDRWVLQTPLPRSHTRMQVETTPKFYTKPTANSGVKSCLGLCLV